MKIGLSLLLVLFASASMQSQTPEATAPSSATASEAPASVTSTSTTTITPDLDRLKAVASQAAADIGRLRIEKWKANGDAKSAAQADAMSVQRNLTLALPGMIDAVRSTPANVNAEFKLYRNLNALYDVLGALTEASRVSGQKGEYDTLSQQLQVIGSVRRKLGEDLEQLTATQERELKQLQIQVKAQQEQLVAAQAEAAEARKAVVVAQSEPPKKAPQKKKTAVKKPAASAGGSNPNPPGSNSSGQTVSGNSAPKP